MSNKKHIDYDMVWNNLRFIPDRKNIWYRGNHKGNVFHSDINIEDRIISISYFTYGDLLKPNPEPLKSGWEVRIYQDNDIIASLSGIEDHIVAKDIDDAEKQALKWAKTI